MFKLIFATYTIETITKWPQVNTEYKEVKRGLKLYIDNLIYKNVRMSEGNMMYVNIITEKYYISNMSGKSFSRIQQQNKWSVINKRNEQKVLESPNNKANIWG